MITLFLIVLMKWSSVCSLGIFKQRMVSYAVNHFWGVAPGGRRVPGWAIPTAFRQPPLWEVQRKHLSPELLCGLVNKPLLLWWFQKWDCCPQGAVFCPFRGQPLTFKALFSNAETAKRQMLMGVFPDTSPGPWQGHFPPTAMKQNNKHMPQNEKMW